MTLALFAHAVAGRPVPLERSGSTRLGYTDGETIHLPADLPADTVQARRLVMTQAVLLRTDALQARHLRRLSRPGPVVAQRYLAHEIVRGCCRHAGILPRRAVAEVLAVLEGAEPSRSAEESLRRALSTEALGDLPDWFGQLYPGRVRRNAGSAADGPAAGEADGSAAAAMLAEGEDLEDDEESDADADGERSRIMELLSSPLRSSLGDALQKMLGAKRSRSSDSSGAGAEMPVAGGRWVKGGTGQGRLVPGAGRQQVRMAGHLVSGAAYPEWDTRRGEYREDWTLVGEFDPAIDPERKPAGSSGDRLLMRRLAQLGLSWRTRRGEQTGDSLDLTALIELRTRIAAGEGGEAAVYTAPRRTSQRLGVLILLDATGSTAERSEGHQVFADQRELAYQLTSALDGLGVRAATYGFYSRGRGNVRFLHVKSFDEAWDSAAQRRMLSIEPSGFTRLGAAVRHATHVIATRAGTDHQLVVVIGDGVVYDDGYEGRYASEDSRFAIEEAAARGVALVGLSVQPTPDESVWPPEQHRVTRDTTELAGVVLELFGTALRRSRGACRPTSTTRRSHHVGAGV